MRSTREIPPVLLLRCARIPLPPLPCQVLECANKFKSQQKAAVLEADRSDAHYKVGGGRSGAHPSLSRLPSL